MTPLEFLRHLKRAPFRCRALQASPQALRNRSERRIKGLDVRNRQGLHNEPALRLPRGAFGGKETVAADFGHHGFDRRKAAIQMRPFAHDGLKEVGLRPDRDHHRTEPIAIRRTVLDRPSLEHGVHRARRNLERIAEERQPRRPGKIAHLLDAGIAELLHVHRPVLASATCLLRTLARNAGLQPA
jgi:hypothetical protein